MVIDRCRGVPRFVAVRPHTSFLFSLASSLTILLLLCSTGEAQSFDLVAPPLQERFRGLTPVIVDVPIDPAYGDTPSRYEGYRLSDMLAVLGVAQGGPGREIIFVCSDGYRVYKRLDELPLERGIVAFRDAGAGAWRSYREGKTAQTPAPYLLVWEGITTKEEQKQLPWPYQLVEIVVTSPTDVTIAPQKGVDDGQNLFRQYCLSCHSINKEGGSLGPELNVPRNITEYRSMEYLAAWIKNPQAFRWRSRMPTFAHLTDKEVNAILKYLVAMKKRKVCSSESGCGP